METNKRAECINSSERNNFGEHFLRSEANLIGEQRMQELKTTKCTEPGDGGKPDYAGWRVVFR